MQENNNRGYSWGDSPIIFTSDCVIHENYWRITPLVTQKSLYTATHILSYICNICGFTSLFQCYDCVMRIKTKTTTITSSQTFRENGSRLYWFCGQTSIIIHDSGAYQIARNGCVSLCYLVVDRLKLCKLTFHKISNMALILALMATSGMLNWCPIDLSV